MTRLYIWTATRRGSGPRRVCERRPERRGDRESERRSGRELERRRGRERDRGRRFECWRGSISGIITFLTETEGNYHVLDVKLGYTRIP